MSYIDMTDSNSRWSTWGRGLPRESQRRQENFLAETPLVEFGMLTL